MIKLTSAIVVFALLSIGIASIFRSGGEARLELRQRPVGDLSPAEREVRVLTLRKHSLELALANSLDSLAIAERDRQMATLQREQIVLQGSQMQEGLAMEKKMHQATQETFRAQQRYAAHVGPYFAAMSGGQAVPDGPVNAGQLLQEQAQLHRQAFQNEQQMRQLQLQAASIERQITSAIDRVNIVRREIDTCRNEIESIDHEIAKLLESADI